MFLPAELIKKKRSGQNHTDAEIDWLIKAYSGGELPDYQMAAWLMAVFFRGMSPAETARLTHAMLHSGRTLEFKGLPAKAVDKHSTGGVGDKASMILAPIAAAAGVPVPMIAGRGLGHTGGTLDKLESMPGFNIRLGLEQFTAQIRQHGLAMIGQTEEICPADRKIYALRDVTATVESLPLICASIMSKKLAEGIDGLVLDVKYGSGAFMKTIADADQLANKLKEIGELNGKAVVAFLSNMDQPLGRFIGNSLEMEECIGILRGQPVRGRPLADFQDIVELSLELAAAMIWLSGLVPDHSAGMTRAREILNSGKAWVKFQELCQCQNGNWQALPQAKHSRVYNVPSNGYLAQMQTEQIGLAAISLGAGRLKSDDAIDHAAGIEVHHKLGDAVKGGQPLFTLYCNDASRFAAAEKLLAQATTISLQKVPPPALIEKRIFKGAL